ncbi:hypothetical protein DYB25_013007 [Aphanomyces astaci]|uniref:PH domain-containing protein n=1 Tax=Aphanomyces astaci TaxID=112090 RepID=A0A397DEK2_APHAT|nr:hypothetical protein DYB25_013007 [Aphanomyces astaci]RHY63551.1 hypothetical protein DYB38_002086 [Aphanomyces astaci]
MKSAPPPSPQCALGEHERTPATCHHSSITVSQRHQHTHALNSSNYFEKAAKKENRTISQIKNGLRSITHKASSLFDDSTSSSSTSSRRPYPPSHSSSSSEHSRTSSQVTLCQSPSTTPIDGLLIHDAASPRLTAPDDSDDEHAITMYIRDLTPDPRKILRGRGSSALVRAVIRANMIDCMSCKWASGYFSYVSYGVRQKQLSTLEANSLRWLICQYIILEATRRNAVQQVLRDQLTRKLTDFRIAVQCVSGMTVVKYGRKGKPHATQLLVENADVIRWTPKLGHHLTSMLQQHKHKSISLSTVISVQSGIKSDVFRKAYKDAKGMLDPACCLSLVTPTRSLDVVTTSRQQCDWLQRSVQLMVAQAHENEKKASMHVETTIMKKLGSMTVHKHGRKGRPHKTNLNVDKYGEITWKGKSGGAILLQEVLELRLGHATAVFHRVSTQKANNPNHCLSLVTASRTLDLELHSESERDYMVIAFRYVQYARGMFDLLRL